VWVGTGVSVGGGTGVSVGGDFVGVDVETDVGVDVGCAATTVEVGENELVMDETSHPGNRDMASARPIT
jgi:hypothetical protein